MKSILTAPAAVAWLLAQLIRETWEEIRQEIRDFRNLAERRGEE